MTLIEIETRMNEGHVDDSEMLALLAKAEEMPRGIRERLLEAKKYWDDETYRLHMAAG